MAQDQGPMEGYCEDGSEPSHSMKSGKVLDKLSKYQLLKKDSEPRNKVNKSVYGRMAYTRVAH
jgi:hypothetical protein